jgi:hypothetical protein
MTETPGNVTALRKTHPAQLPGCKLVCDLTQREMRQMWAPTWKRPFASYAMKSSSGDYDLLTCANS